MRGLAPLLLLGLAACGGSPAPAGDGTAIPVVDAAGLRERAVPEGDDRLVLLNFWATWCPPCVAEMPALEEVHATWRDRGVRVLAVSLDLGTGGTVEKVAGFAEARDLDMPIVAYDGDPKDLASSWRLGSSIPTTVLVDPSGEVVGHHVGANDVAGFERMIAAALDE